MALVVHVLIVITTWKLCYFYVGNGKFYYEYFEHLGSLLVFLLTALCYKLAGFILYQEPDKTTYASSYTIFYLLIILLIIVGCVGFELMYYYYYTNPVFLMFLGGILPNSIITHVIIAAILPPCFINTGIKIGEIYRRVFVNQDLKKDGTKKC